MEVLVRFLIDNYIYFVFVAILLVLGLIGYIVDTSKTNKLKKEYTKQVEENVNVPIANMDVGIKLGSALNEQQNITKNNEQNSVEKK